MAAASIRYGYTSSTGGKDPRILFSVLLNESKISGLAPQPPRRGVDAAHSHTVTSGITSGRSRVAARRARGHRPPPRGRGAYGDRPTHIHIIYIAYRCRYVAPVRRTQRDRATPSFVLDLNAQLLK